MTAPNRLNSGAWRLPSLSPPSQELIERLSIPNCPLTSFCSRAVIIAILQPGWRPMASAWTRIYWIKLKLPRMLLGTKSHVRYSVVFPIWNHQEWKSALASLWEMRHLRQCQILSSSIRLQKWQLMLQRWSWTRMSLYRLRLATRILFQCTSRCNSPNHHNLLQLCLKFLWLSSHSRSITKWGHLFLAHVNCSNYRNYKFRLLLSFKQNQEINCNKQMASAIVLLQQQRPQCLQTKTCNSNNTSKPSWNRRKES